MKIQHPKTVNLKLPHNLDFKLITVTKTVPTGFNCPFTGYMPHRTIDFKHWEASGIMYEYHIQHNCKEYYHATNWYMGPESFVARKRLLCLEEQEWELIVPSYEEEWGSWRIPSVSTLALAKKQCNDDNQYYVEKAKRWLML